MTVEQNPDHEAEELSVKWMKRCLTGIGSIFVLVGLVRQWPILGKTYMEFIEGNGYMSLIMGLIMIVLGFSVRLLMGPPEEDEDPKTPTDPDKGLSHE